MSQLSSLVESQLQYHKQAVQVLEELSDKLRDRYGIETWHSLAAFCLSLLKCGSVMPHHFMIWHRGLYMWNSSQFIFLNRMNDAQSRPRREYTPKPKPIFDFGDNNHSNGGYSTSMAPPPSRNSGKERWVWRWVIKNEIFFGVDLISTFCRQHLSKIHLVWGGWLYGCPKSVCCVWEQKNLFLCIILYSSLQLSHSQSHTKGHHKICGKEPP